jgi:hypothetical protein
MTTTETFDAFEQRLVAAMTAEAETVAEPADGLDRIRGRVVRRRRARRATWLAAAAVLVFIAGTVGVLLRSSSTDSAPYVDTDSTGGMPLLGFEDQTMSVTLYVPGVLYVVPDATTLDNGVTTSMVVWREGSGYSPGIAPLTDGQETEVAGQPATTGEIEAGDGRRFLATAWEPAPGWKGMLALEESAIEGDPVAMLADAAARVRPADLAAFSTAVEPGAPGPEGGLGHPLPPLVPAEGVAGTALLEVRPSSRLTMAFPEQTSLGRPAELQIRVGEDRTPDPDGAEELIVRGTRAVAYLERGPDGADVRILKWVEANDTYVLRISHHLPVADEIRFAESLRLPTAEQWRTLLFPDPPPPWPEEQAFDW